MTLQATDFDHRCTHDDCPSKGQRTDRLSCRCHISREDMMLAEIARLRAVWQPIETAPRDGSWFLTWDSHYGIRRGRCHVRADHDDWLSYGDSFNGSSKGGIRATHWRPLPSAPSKEGSDGRAEKVRRDIYERLAEVVEQVAHDQGKSPSEVINQAKDFIRRAALAAPSKGGG